MMIETKPICVKKPIPANPFIIVFLGGYHAIPPAHFKDFRPNLFFSMRKCFFCGKIIDYRVIYGQDTKSVCDTVLSLILIDHRAAGFDRV